MSRPPFLRLPERAQTLAVTAGVSVAAALSAVAFLVLTNFLFKRTYEVFAGRSKLHFAFASLIVILAGSLLVAFLLRIVPQAAGSGVPQIKAVYWKEMGYLKPRNVVVKFIAGVLSIGAGNSLGREGPSIYVGAGTASCLSGLGGIPPRERRGATAIGAAAGLAAAFNAPLAAITFVIEEIIGDFNSRFLGRVVLSSVAGAFIVHALIGRQPAFSLPSVERVSWTHYLVVPFAAGLASLAGLVFQRLVIAWRAKLRAYRRFPRWLLPVAGGLITWILGVAVFWTTGKVGVFGLGYRDLSAALNNQFPWQIAGVMILAKLLATAVGYSFEGSGGIFAPALFIGGMSGYFLAGLAGIWLPLTPADHVVLSAVGMSACLGTIVRAPLTSLLIVFEMTHQFELVPGLMLAMIVSQAVARGAGRLNFYDALLVQDGHELHKVRPPVDLQSWQNLKVEAIAHPRVVALSDLGRKAMKDLIDRFPYGSFPVLLEGRLRGIVTRDEIKEAVLADGSPEIRPAVTCYPDQTVREIGDKFIESPVPLLVVIGREDGAVRGIITLHDLIRAQAALQQ